MIPFYECTHCEKKLTTQERLDKHSCEPKRRYEIMQTMRGKSAFSCYKAWMLECGRPVYKSSTFRRSKYFTPFLRFCEFCKSMGIPDRKFFIKLMVERNIDPMYWSNVDYYEYYIEEFDKMMTPSDLATITVQTFFDLSRAYECDVTEIFDHIEVTDLAKLIHYRKISPWVLLFCKKFNAYLQTKTKSQKLLINTVIDPKHWFAIFSEDMESVRKMKIYVNELAL